MKLTSLHCQIFIIAFLTTVAGGFPSTAQQTADNPDRVMTLMGGKSGARDLPQDHGVAGTWQKLRKLRTTASVLYTTAHPDDEQGGMLTYLSRGVGARTAMLTLNRGEGGSNVMGPELFDALGLLRTEETLLAGTYYGLDDLYFTAMADYGYSKRLEEALAKWGKEAVLREMVRVIRLNRPLVMVSRFHGSARDGHGNHETAGVLSQEAYHLAGDPKAFPEQLTREGLRPWQPFKLYRGGIKPGEQWNLSVFTGTYSPWLGESYENFGWLGYSFHRSQFSGIRRVVSGSTPLLYERLSGPTVRQVSLKEKEETLFEGLDTSLSGLFNLTGETAPSGAATLLKDAEAQVEKAVAAFNVQNPATIVPFLTTALNKTRALLGLLSNQPEAAFMLRIKERQLMEAIHAALGVEWNAIAVRAGTNPPANPYAPLPTMGPVVPGQPFAVQATLVNPGKEAITFQGIEWLANGDWKPGQIQSAGKVLQPNEKVVEILPITVPGKAAFSQPYFSRKSLLENQYTTLSQAYQHLPFQPPALMAVARYLVNGELVEVRETVRTREANFPYGYQLHSLKVAPVLAVNLKPSLLIFPLDRKGNTFPLKIELVYNGEKAVRGELTVHLPTGWKTNPVSVPFSFTQPGEKTTAEMTVTVPLLSDQAYEIRAVATVNGETYAEGFDLVSARDLDDVYSYHPAVTTVKGVSVKVAPQLNIGYVMGVGDEVPASLEQLGARVQLLSAGDLASGKLNLFDAIMVGVRAYAIRKDLVTFNRRLLDYAQQGGNLIVLFQTQEFVPGTMAPYHAQLPPEAEEVSEEDSPVQLLAANHPVLRQPNAITLADFNGWVEQRGSKFFSEWDNAYTPIVATQDQGQAPQSGGWLVSRYGKGYYSYFAYAIHRQLRYGIPGAYRITANLISLGKSSAR